MKEHANPASSHARAGPDLEIGIIGGNLFAYHSHLGRYHLSSCLDHVELHALLEGSNMHCTHGVVRHGV